MQNGSTLPFSQPATVNNTGLCGDCVNAQRIKSDRGSVFIQCQMSFSDPEFAKYPRLPVLACEGYRRHQVPVDGR